MFPKLPSQYQMEAYQEMQREAFYDLADECDKCGRIYVDDFKTPKGCPSCGYIIPDVD